jgi:peroxiredoxin Q/BCP
LVLVRRFGEASRYRHERLTRSRRATDRDKVDTVVLGVSPDTVERHVKFKTKYGLNFPLLADVDTEIAKKYGVWVEKSNYGRKYMGVQRATFLIGRDGKVFKVWPKVKVEGHAEDVMTSIKELNKGRG